VGVWVSSVPPLVTVTPGEEAVFPITVGNTGSLVDQVSLLVLGEPAGWAEVEPPVLHLLPGAEGQASVRLRPPRLPSCRAGSATIGIKVVSREDPASAVIHEGLVEVAPFEDTAATLQPTIARARTGAEYHLTLSNQGNHAVLATVSPSDPEGVLSLSVAPAQLAMEPGQGGVASIRARARAIVIGRTRRLPFRVGIQVDGAEPTAADATLVQQPLLPWWLLPVAAVVGVVFLLWLASLDPAALIVVLGMAAVAIGAVRVAVKRRRAVSRPVTPPGWPGGPPAPPPPPPA
jgi:hypothetical protein